MYTTSTNYKTKILEASRSFQCRITIGSVVLTNDDIVDIILDSPQPSDGFMIGSTTSQSLDLTILNKGDTIYSTNQVKVEIGLNTGAEIEYILMGYYNIDDVVKTDYTIKFTCYDNMIKFETPYITNYGDTPTLQQVVNDLTRITGVQFTGSLPSYTVKKLEGYTCREILSYVASICGGNAAITRAGKFTILYPTDSGRTITGSNYIDFKREESPYKIGKITCQNGEDSLINKGTLGTDSMELSFENPWVTDTILTDIYNRLNGFTYLGYTMKWQGDLSLDPGDIITVTDVKGVVRKIPILSQRFTYTGGLTSEIGAKGETKNKNSFSSSGNTSKQVQRVVTRLLLAEEAIISKANIQDLNAVSIRTQTLETKTASIETLVASKANITDLNATNANIASLVAADVTINNLLAAKATIIDLNAAKARIGTLESSTADIGTIRSNLATITTLVNGNLTSNNIQSLVLTSDKVTVANGFIKNAMIENLDVSKINSGTINTNKFTISSTDGAISIVGATQQFKDKLGNVRIQMGQDTSGNFNFIVKAEDGTTTLIDGYGVKEGALADKLIKTRMVADNAIGETQINYSSLITGLNKDTNTSLIKASKVNIDLTGQTLEVAFNSLKSNVDGIEVGGRNLIVLSNLGSYTSYNSTPTVNNNVISTVRSANPFAVTLNVNGWTPENKQYTLSGIMKVNGNPVTNAMWTSKTSSSYCTATQYFYLDDTTGKFIIKATYSGAKAWILHTFITGVAGDVITLDQFKMELGNKATDWSPAPEDVDAKIETNTTAINVQQGRIDTLISQTSIMQGDITTISDNYSSLNQSVSGLSSTVGSHTTSISTLNTNVGTAQTTANNANTLADSKAKVFTATPTIPYKVGDLWVQGLSGDTMKCKVARASGSYTATDWEKASKYTDDTKANSVASDLSAVTTRVTSAETAITQNANSIALKVNTSDFTTYKNTNDSAISALTTRTSNTESSVSVLQTQIVSKVSQTEIDNSINVINIGGRNIIPLTKLASGTTTLVNNYSFRTKSWATIIMTTENVIKYFAPNTKYKIKYKATLESGSALPAFSREIKFNLNVKDVSNLYFGLTTDLTTVGSSVWVEKEFTTPADLSNMRLLAYTQIFSDGTTIEYGQVLFEYLKIEKGDKATDYTVAPEDLDQQITDVLNSIDTKISTAKSEIKQTTDSISANVTSLQTTTSTLTTQMGNKAETSTVTAISNRTSSLEANVSSITSRVSSVESTTNTINGTVASQGTRLSTAETKLTDSAFTVQIQKNASKIYKVRYIRDWINGSNINSNNHWVEMQAINNVGVNLASGKAPTSNASITNATYITDGVLTSSSYAMGSAGTLQYVQIDLGAVYQNLDLLKIWHYYGDGRTYHNTKTEVSEDGVNWLPVFDSAVSGEYAETQYGHTIQLNTNSINTSSTTINEGGVTINNGALTVKNSNSEVIIDGQHNMHKIVVSGIVNVRFDSSQTISTVAYVDIPHNLGYKPCFACYVQGENDYIFNIPYIEYVNQSGGYFGIGLLGRAWCNNATLEIVFRRPDDLGGSSRTITVKYYIYKEVAI